MLPAAYSALDASPLPEGCATILRLLAAASPNWPEVALVAARDPVLCLALLAAAPLAAGELDAGLNAVLRRRLESLGSDLLRAWMLGVGRLTAAAAGNDAQALLRGECALHLALETRYPRPDEAYLGGLWFNLPARICSARTDGPAAPGISHESDQRHEFSRLVRACGLSDALCDGLELEPSLVEQLQDAHPLVRLLHAAQWLAADDWQARSADVAALTGLSAASVASLRTDVAYIVSGHAAYPPPADTAAGEVASIARVDDPFREAAIAGLLNAAFADLDIAQVAARLAVGSPFFGLAIETILLFADDDGRLRPLLPGAPGTMGALIDELGLCIDDERSCIALAARCGEPAGHAWSRAGPRRSTADWHVARWLGQRSFSCLPLPTAGNAVIALLPDTGGTAGCSLATGLLGAAARAILSARRRDNDAAAREAVLQQRFREHVRKIAHEATNPLTVIKNRLDLLGQRHAEDTPLQDEMVLLNAELDRIDNLLRRAADLPVDAAEAPTCRVTDLLLEMRAMYGDPLFARQGIGLELRAARDVPDAALPASALRQVLLNLFRNASEVLQPGKRLTVSVMGGVIVDGRAHLELRVADNGPGLPRDRLTDLFSPRPSIKGGGHQGVGLSVVRDILARWKAAIVCRSQPGNGTSFQIFLPLDQSGRVLHHVTDQS
ncbi:MAG: HAMP domain-containing histidine kinase [Betaproteobacteria bacterium]|nr:MAG: HAMP domain-containing histidine kinase [Betaproteobacteria bacterium]